MLLIKTISLILNIIGVIALIPSVLLVPALIITVIIGLIKKDYSYLKKYIKLWAYSLAVLIGVLLFYAISQFILNLLIESV